MNFRDVDGNLRAKNICPQDLVELFLGLLHGQPGHMDASGKRHLYVAIAVNPDRLVRRSEFGQFRFGNLQLIIRPQKVRGTSLAVALGLRLVEPQQGRLPLSTCEDDQTGQAGHRDPGDHHRCRSGHACIRIRGGSNQ